MLKARDHLALASCDGALYALGGWSGSRNRASCERYDPRDDKWVLMPRQRLCTARSGHGAAVSDDGSIFAMAGWGGAAAGFLSTIECVRPAAADSEGHSWTVPESAPLHLARHCPAVAAIGRYVYVVGGSGSTDHLVAAPTATVERLDTRRLDSGWEPNVASMQMPRYRHAMAVLHGMLYCTGGQAADGRATATVERFDPMSGTWTDVTPMGHARFSHAAAALDGMLYVVGGFAAGECPTPAHSRP